jgi:adenosine kinase
LFFELHHCCFAALQVKYMVDPTTATGTCAVCIVGGERSLVANLAAANNFKVGPVTVTVGYRSMECASMASM